MPDPRGQPDPLRQKVDAQQLDLFVRRLQGLPTLPQVARRLLELTAAATEDDSPGGPERLDAITAVVSSDQSLTARVLSMAGGGTVQQAVRQLGIEGIRAAVLSIQVFQTLVPGIDSGLDRSAFWRHCLAVASAAEMLSQRLRPAIDSPEAFLCGLLHDVGKLALEQCLPKSYRRVLEAAGRRKGNIAEYERLIIGVDHCIAGKRLAQQWLLPQAVQEVAWLHHQPFEALPPSLPRRELIALVGLADAVARREGLGFSGNYSFPHAVGEMAGPLGLSETDVSQVAQGLAQRLQHHAATLGLDEAGHEPPYPSALAGAAAELAEANQQLRRKASTLETQAKAFTHLRDFFSGLSPQSTVPDVLAGAAAVVAGVCGIEPTRAHPIVVYSCGEEAQAVLAGRLDGSSGPAWRTLSRAAGFDAARGAADDGAAQVMQALLADPDSLAEWIDVDCCLHQPLVCAGRWVGGLLLPQAAPLPEAPAREILQALAGAAALALAIVQGKTQAVLLSEQLTVASQVLADAQEALAEARTATAIGEMAAGAAHELNNPLAVVSGRAQRMRDRAGSEEERKVWKLIAEQAQRISDIITELMAFASPAPPSPQAIEARALLAAAAEAFSSSAHPQSKAARVDIEVGPEVPPAWADAKQMQEVLVELITNAANAAADQGGAVPAAQGGAKPRPGPHVVLSAQCDELSGGAVLLTVADEGPGMDEPTAQRAFAPFFSSRPAGRRRGMGLPRARTAVENNGGRMWLRSKAGQGTTVFMLLPATSAGLDKKEGSDADR